ncbi:LamG-like jellyroll fold domain-containing protein [Aeromonas caviae]|uniref:LamG-like jellyroll fold domain-containing protein n=1 Tax=Aeromonas caviae TaxID=648 RepID=UPI0029DD3923|nr:LamG-like jellyroll fold domain-containing protein [Aeromonas caviae]MDX7609426.1 LamG-like jellyroll fold domain-containing protein [Aeromonas caviae]
MASDQALRDLILASNPVVYYPLDNPSNLGLDLSANAHHGSQSGTFSQQIKTLFGMDLTMTKGVSSPLVTVPDRAEFRGNKLTIELVVAGVADENVVWLERGGANNNWSVQSYTSAQAPGQVPAFGSFLGVPTPPSVFQGAASNLPGLAHIVLVMDGAKLSTAVNGSVSQTSLNTSSGSQVIQTAVPLHLFSRGGTAGPSNGYMAHVAIYNRLLTSDEILARHALLFGSMGWEVHHLTAIPANQEPRSQFEPQDVVWRGSPGAVYAGPMPAAAVTADPLCKGQDLNWVRDGNQNVLQGYIESTVTIDGEGVRRRVLCLDQAGNLIGETSSRASDGKYRFDLLWLNRRYMLVAQDDPAFGPADYNAVAADYQLPTPYAPGEGVGLV